ncbi:hypothetical protein NIES1031_03920 [Chroogloeocystis siderophila 5.2 s.c.1]|uniref:InsA N-terminal zinc ribbon domain-containing protein n=1 Tax=Chroogloeocystis siderophila 5.2 s.c.1 TaxID=247279 RepID=A0A1U7HXV3_9CHRO|nr:hypothetical protein NIES1031_03920 [Chroogloeocystis siderophila 5.2 s.c.1]
MECRLCGHAKVHKHGKMPNGHQRYFCPNCKQTFSESMASSGSRQDDGIVGRTSLAKSGSRRK